MSRRSSNRSRSQYRKPASGARLSGRHPSAQEFVELDVSTLGYDGRGIARYQGRACFVESALPGEQVKAQITAANNKRVEAKLIKVLSPSEFRTEPLCPVYQKCGGCDLQHLAHQQQIEQKKAVVEQMLKRTAAIDSPEWLSTVESQKNSEPAVPSGYGYRRKIRLACYFDRSQQRLNVGFREAKSKKIVDVQACKVLNPELTSLMSKVYQLVDSFHNLEAEHKFLGDIAHIECIADSDSLSVCFRLLKPLINEAHQMMLEWAEKHHLNLWLRVADQTLEQVFGNHSYSVFEDGSKIAYSPEDFLQVNASVNEQMVVRVMTLLELTEQDRLLDLFSGLGNFSIPAAKSVNSVLAVEAVEEMVEKSKQNAVLNRASNFSTECQDLFDSSALSWLENGFDKVILDPPRAGAELVSQHIGKTGAEKIAYVSCNPMSLARDAVHLQGQGYRLQSLTLLDMFAQTSHIETLALFVRS
jgi:23S rRNA (uracil1939-C5)-methyltransferase